MWPPIINVMDNAARKAARGLIHDFGEIEQLQSSKNEPIDFATKAFLNTKSTLKTELEKARPDFAIIFSETEFRYDQKFANRWIVKTLDGSTNFLHGIPHFAISIAYEERNELIAGMVYDPLRDETFWALKGKGCYLNNRRLRVSARRKLESALIASNSHGQKYLSKPGLLEAQGKEMNLTAGFRLSGTIALDLAYVAAGRYDAFWNLHLTPTDVAAGIVLVREAGGLLSDVNGKNNPMKSGSIIATNNELFNTVSLLLQNISPKMGAKNSVT